MKKVDLYAFQRGLNMSKFVHPRVTYAINKNKRLIQSVIEDMEKIIAPSEEFNKFAKEREEQAKNYAEKDETGKPKTEVVAIPGRGPQRIYVVPDQANPESPYRKALSKLEADYKEVIEDQNEKVRKYNTEFLEDETEFQPFMVDLDLMEAHEKCPQEVMDLIYWMIREPLRIEK